MAKALKGKPWTSVDSKALKKLAQQKTGAEKIAKTLKRTLAAVRNRAVIEQISLSTRSYRAAVAACISSSPPNVAERQLSTISRRS